MDPMELRSGKTLEKGDLRGESGDDLEEDMGSLMEAGNATSGNVEEEVIPSGRIGRVDNLHPPPSFSAMDISSVRVPPGLATMSLELTSTRGLPKSATESLRMARFYTN